MASCLCINDNQEAYIGETVNIARRMREHLQNPTRRKLKEINIICDEKFNKFVILDLESFLISHMASDGKYILQNGNSGLQDHNYYNRNNYEKNFTNIWNELRKHGIVDKSIDEIENSDLFKYSPYKALGFEQKEIEHKILEVIINNMRNNKCTTVLIRGGAGTGKTILAVYLLKLFADVSSANFVESRDDLYSIYAADNVYAIDNITGINKVGIVLPQASLRSSIKDVFRNIRGLEKSMILSSSDVVDNYVKTGEKYDLLIVDEAHRLKCRNHGHLSSYPKFDECNRRLDLDKQLGNELDWIGFLCAAIIKLYLEMNFKQYDLVIYIWMSLQNEFSQNAILYL